MCVAAIDPLEPVTVWELERQVPEHCRHRERGLAENLSAVAAGQEAPIERQQCGGQRPHARRAFLPGAFVQRLPANAGAAFIAVGMVQASNKPKPERPLVFTASMPGM